MGLVVPHLRVSYDINRQKFREMLYRTCFVPSHYELNEVISDTCFGKIHLVVHEILSVLYFAIFIVTTEAARWSICEKNK